MEAQENFYQAGLDLLVECQTDHTVLKYQKAIDLLIVAYLDKVHSAAVFELLVTELYNPNLVAMKAQYAANKAYLQDSYPKLVLPEFTQLNFLLFPVNKDCCWIFDQRQERFLGQAEININIYCYAKMLKQALKVNEIDFLVKVMQRLTANSAARNLYQSLQISLATKLASQVIYDKIMEYHRLRPECEKYEYLLAQYYVNKQEYRFAEQWTRKGLRKRTINFELSLLLAQICQRLGKFPEAAARYIYLRYTPQSMSRDFSPVIEQILQLAKAESEEVFQETLRQMGLYDANVIFAPTLQAFAVGPTGKIERYNTAIFGKYLGLSNRATDFFVGIYNFDRYFNASAYMFEKWQSFGEENKRIAGSFYRFDFMKGKMVTNVMVSPQKPCLLALMPTKEYQEIAFTYNNTTKTIQLGKYESNFFRVAEDVTISSSLPIIMSEQIPLQHNPRRKKFVLNILIDALSFGYLKKENFASMPNTKQFFAKGTIFMNTYAVAECTYPSLATIETGMYQHHSQIFHPEAYTRLAETIKPTPQHFKDNGYYCVNVVGVSEGIYNGIDDGYDRMIMNFDVSRAAEGVERTIQHLMAFGETDNFINIHFSDVHPPYDNMQVDLVAQTNMTLAERFAYDEGLRSASVYRAHCEQNVVQYQKAVRDTDRALGQLFAFIEANYSDDEYIVNLYSDHGHSALSADRYFFSEEQSCSALMLRGANVPCGIVVEDELVSALDIHSILGYLADYAIDENIVDSRLPKLFGGVGREYVISQATYPGQTYKLCIRTREYEFRLETKDLLAYDGHINIDQFTWHIYTRGVERQEVFAVEVLEYFLTIAYDHTKSMHDPMYNRVYSAD